jgi:hypothetical protein
MHAAVATVGDVEKAASRIGICATNGSRERHLPGADLGPGALAIGVKHAVPVRNVDEVPVEAGRLSGGRGACPRRYRQHDGYGASGSHFHDAPEAP